MELLEYPLKTRLTAKQIDFISRSFVQSFSGCGLSFNETSITCTPSSQLEAGAIAELLKKLLFIARGVDRGRTLYSHQNDARLTADPLIVLEQRREVVPIGPGLFLFQGEFLRVFRAANHALYLIAVNEFDAVEQENPALWPIDLFRKVNYFQEFPHQALIVSGVDKSFDNLRRFASQYAASQNFDKVQISHGFEPARFGLQPAVCDTCYYSLTGSADVTNTVYTTCNKVFRNECSEAASLDRLPAFTVRDIMFVGDKTFVLQVRQRLIDRLEAFLAQTTLDCAIEVADDPFFSSTIEKKLFQQQFELKYELLADIPYLGKRIAVGSINLHLDSFSSAFNFSSGGQTTYSGCIGIGFERLLLAFYSQFGTSVRAWPSSLLSLLRIHGERQ